MAVTARPRRRLDAVRRPQILATAVDLVRAKGLWKVRISDVARRAGVSPASVVYYFGTKDELFVQAISGADDAFYAELEPELLRLSDPIERLALLVVRSSASDWLLWVDLWLYACHSTDPNIKQSQRRFNRRWRDAIASAIRYGTELGAWRAQEPDQVALRLAAITDGLAVQMLLEEPDHSREQYVRMTLEAAALELDVSAEALLSAAARVPRPEVAR
jgi:AcrR family transcriptional regulator